MNRRTALVSTFAALTNPTGAQNMSNVVLIGDSIFDNGAYVAGGPDVRQQLSNFLPAGSQATLLARDGAVISDAVSQVRHLPPDATHVVVSAGGNDALRESGVLNQPA